MTAADQVLYGSELEPIFQLLKERTVRTLALQGFGLSGMALMLLTVSWLTAEWALALLGLLVLALALVPMTQARDLDRRMENLLVTTEGIRLPMPLRQLGGSSLLPRQAIARVDSQKYPNSPRILFHPARNFTVRPVTLEKDFIFDWTGFMRAVNALGVEGADVPPTPGERPMSMDLKNPQAVRRLRSIFSGFGVLAGVLLGIGYIAASDKLLGLAVAALLVAFLLTFLLYRTRGDAIRIRVQNGSLTVRTPLGSSEYPLARVHMFAGATRVTIVDSHGAVHEFTSIDPEIASQLSRFAGALE